MGTENSANLPFNFTYLTTEDGDFLTAEDGAFIYVSTNPFPPAPEFNGSNGNRLLCTSYIVDMDMPRLPGQVVGSKAIAGRSRDAKGRIIYWD